MASAAPRGLLGRMMMRKSVAQVQHETQTSELKRSLGPWNLVFLGIGCIIGAGIFVRTGNAAALHAGPAVLIGYAIAGIVCAFAGLCYAELASPRLQHSTAADARPMRPATGCASEVSRRGAGG